MKKFLAVAIGMAMVAGAAYAQSQTFSKNAVGFINTEATEGALYALTVPFDNMDSDDGSWDFEDTQLAKDAAVGSTVYIWDGTTWKEYNKGKKGFGIDPEYATLKPGQCFFFQPSEDMVISMSGEVPDSTNTLVAVAGAMNLSAIANPYPTDMTFEDTVLAQNASVGSTVFIWDGTTWKEYNKGKKGFGIDPEYAVIKPGVGFFFQTTEEDESANWDVEKEYKWP